MVIMRARVGSRSGSILLTVAAVGSVGLVIGLLGRAGAQTAQEVQRFGTTTVKADTFDYDLEKRQVIAVGSVSLESGVSRLTARTMTVQLAQNRTLDWARCEGDVYVEKAIPDEKARVQGWGKTLDYYEARKMAFLIGEARVLLTTPRLDKPAQITGSRIEMNLDTQENRVLGREGEPARIHLDPKADPNGAPPDPVDLVAGTIVMNARTHIYEATDKPVLTRASGRLQAERIVFEVEANGTDLKTARASKNVVFDGKNSKGSLIHTTADDGVYTYATSDLVLTGSVHATIRDPGEDQPEVLQGREFSYNTRTRYSRLKGGTLTIPASKGLPAPPAGGAPKAKS